ncbi:MAG: hypothetical protein HY774_26235, partial [Acidobacteria bacterium]|nr:hypothetical protein [Acidobacteriota bacterium]
MKRYTGLSIGVLWGVLLFLVLPVFVARATHLAGTNEVTGGTPMHRLTVSPRAYSLLRESARLAEPRLPAAVRQAVTFTLQSDKPSATVQAGQSAQFTISAKSPQNVRLSVFLEARGLPVTTSATFVPRGIRPNDDPSRMTVTTQPGTPPGTYPFEVVGTYSGPPRVVQTLPLTLVVTG